MGRSTPDAPGLDHGRDAPITSLQSLLLGPRLAVGTPRMRAAYQARRRDFRDAEPRKMPHELLPAVERALGRIDEPGDLDGDGLMAAIGWFDGHRLPELFRGYDRATTPSLSIARSPARRRHGRPAAWSSCAKHRPASLPCPTAGRRG